MSRIITAPDPRLRQRSKTVEVNHKTLDLVETLRETVVNKEGVTIGVGLSAPQIAHSDRVFIAYSGKSHRFLTFINPEITWYSKAMTKGLPDGKYEGCLSVPNVWSLVFRHQSVKIRYQSETGFWQTKKFSGVTATVIQHEYDHLEGVLFIDRALQQHNQLYEIQKDHNGKEYFAKIKV